MADIERSIAECCKQLKLSANFAGQVSIPVSMSLRSGLRETANLF